MNGRGKEFEGALVSIVIPAYNHADYIGETLDSLINQTYGNMELIVVNDGSSDGTGDVIVSKLPECRERFKRVEYISKENEGIIKTLNRGLALARGEYVYIIASDDMAEADAIETLYGFLSENNDYGLAVGDNYIIDDRGRRCFWNSKRDNVYDKAHARFLTFADKLKRARSDVDFNSEDFGTYESLLQGNYVPNGYLVRKELIDRMGGYSEDGPLEDYYLMLQLSKVAKLKYVDRPLFSYRWHGSNAIKQTGMHEKGFKTLMNEKGYAEEHGYGQNFRDQMPFNKRLGIPFLLEVGKRGSNKRYKAYLRLFGVKVLKWSKKMDRKVFMFLSIPVFKKTDGRGRGQVLSKAARLKSG
ncbi:MAG: glycosyltransferase [Thermodesulfobacteriota bacterium]